MESTPLVHIQSPAFTRQPLVTIEPVQFLFSLYSSGAIPLIDQFVRSQLERRYNVPTSNFTCATTYDDLDGDHIEAKTSTWLIYMNLAAMVPAFISTVLWAGYSDATSRKLAVLPPLIGAAVRLLLFLAIIYFDMHPAFLIVASICDGFGGGMCAMLMASFSYIASVTGSHSRSWRVVIVEVSSGLAVAVSQLCIGYAVHYLGFAWTFVILLSTLFTALCYTVFILPEADVMSATATDSGQFFTTKHFRRVLTLYMNDGEDGSQRHWKLRFTLLLMALTCAVKIGDTDVETLFMLSAPLCFTAVWIGYFFATTFFIRSLVSLVVTHIFVRHVGDLILIVVGLMFGVAYQIMFGLSTNRLMLFTASIVGCTSALPVPLLRAYNSKIVMPHEIAVMFASMAWIEIASSLLGGIVENAVFAATFSWMMNFVFITNAGVYLLTALLTTCFIGWLWYRNQPNHAQQY